jgi:arylsulfatase A-like enzyme
MTNPAILLSTLLLVQLPASREMRPDARPDIVILLTDQHQAAATGFEGTPGFSSPAIDRLAQDGVVFRRAYCTSPQCSPSRASLLTGLMPHRAGVVANVPLPGEPPQEAHGRYLSSDLPSLGHLFREAGYETAYFGKWHLGGSPREHGFEAVYTENFYSTMTGRLLRFFTARNAVARANRRPLLLVASWLNPHDIYEVETATLDMLPALDEVDVPLSVTDDLSTKPSPQLEYLLFDQGRPFAGATVQHWKRYRAFYSYLVKKVDNDLRLIGFKLRETHPEAIVLFASEHGDFAGAHGMPFKGPAMYEELLRIPFIFSWPGHWTPGESNALVSLLDVLPTLCEVAGIDAPPDLDGMSMVPLLEAQDRSSVPWRNSLVFQYHGKGRWRTPIRCLRNQDYKYALYSLYGDELYDLRNDPDEILNLAGDPVHEPVRARMRADLLQWIEDSGDPFFDIVVTDRNGQDVPPR